MIKSLKLIDSEIFGKSVAINKYLLSFHENRLPMDANITALPWWEKI